MRPVLNDPPDLGPLPTPSLAAIRVAIATDPRSRITPDLRIAVNALAATWERPHYDEDGNGDDHVACVPVTVAMRIVADYLLALEHDRLQPPDQRSDG